MCIYVFYIYVAAANMAPSTGKSVKIFLGNIVSLVSLSSTTDSNIYISKYLFTYI